MSEEKGAPTPKTAFDWEDRTSLSILEKKRKLQEKLRKAKVDKLKNNIEAANKTGGRKKRKTKRKRKIRKTRRRKKRRKRRKTKKRGGCNCQGGFKLSSLF